VGLKGERAGTIECYVSRSSTSIYSYCKNIIPRVSTERLLRYELHSCEAFYIPAKTLSPSFRIENINIFLLFNESMVSLNYVSCAKRKVSGLSTCKILVQYIVSYIYRNSVTRMYSYCQFPSQKIIPLWKIAFA
jgi:hypothetical protein